MVERKTSIAAISPENTGTLSLPRSAERADEALVDRAVVHIRSVVEKTVARGLDDVGTYLLREFYDDDPELYRSSSPAKHASLALLLDRCESLELPVHRTFLANALRVVSVQRQLPRSASFRQLPPSHRVELVRVGEPEKIEQLASQAVEEKLSVQKLRTLVQREQDKAKEPGRGRKRSPEVLKAIEACLRLLRDEDTGRLLFHKRDISKLTEEQLSRANTTLTTLEKRVAELRRLLG